MPSSRYIHLFTEPPKRESDWHTVQKDIEEALRKNVERVQQSSCASQGRRESVYIGDAGIAFMQLTLATKHLRLSNFLSENEQNLLSPALLTSLADRHLTEINGNAISLHNNIRDGAHVSFLETSVGIACLILSRYPIGGQKSFARAQWKSRRDYLLKAVETIARDDAGFAEDHDGCEVLYGRAGFLYALLYLRSMQRKKESQSELGEEYAMIQDIESCRELLSDATLGVIVNSIIGRGRNGAKAYQIDFGNKSPRLMWTWHGERYLGGAHGVAGILQILLRCPFSIIAEYMPEIVQTVDWLVTCQDRTGNWPTRAPEPSETITGEHELVQWCHGAPAMLILLSTILRMSVTPGITVGLTERQQDRFVISLQRGCALVYMRGLPRKGVGPCHGVAGSVYALLAASDVLDIPCNVSATHPEKQGSKVSSSDHHAPYFTQAAHLAHLATYASSLTRKGDMKIPEHPWSLFEGMAGMCCAWGEVLFRMNNRERTSCLLCSGMPGYDDIL